jgi:AbrB family looped-hinge helix DNA binding protein
MPDANPPVALGGFAVVDDEGRVALPQAVRDSLGLGPGSTIAYLVVDGHVAIIPHDRELARLMDDAAAALERAGLSTQDLLDRLPAIRERVMRRTYGDAFVEELAREQARLLAARGT